MSNIKNFFRSLPFKLSIIITGIVLFTLIVMALRISSLAYNIMYENAVERSYSAINHIIKSMEISQSESEEEIANVSNNFLNTQEHIQEIISFFLVENPWVSTAKLSFLEGKGEDCAFISHSDSLGRIVTEKLTNTEDYAYLDSYINTNTENYWTDPFYNESRGLIVCSYICPIRDKETDEIIALWEVDVEFHKLEEYINNYLPYSHSYGYIVDQNGTYLSHPNKECELRKYDEFDEKYKNEAEERIYNLMLSGKEGSEVIKINGKHNLVLFSPYSRYSSSLAIVCPFDDIYKDVIYAQSRLWHIFIIAIIFVAFCIFALIYIIMRPLSGFATAVKAVANGEYDAPLPKVISKDELSDFHDAISYLQSSLESNIEKLKQSTAQSARIENELLLAKNIQTYLLAHNFTPYLDYPLLDMYAYLHPAREVGGDLYDFFIRDSKLFFVIADVSGKGVPASIFMAMAYKIFRVFASKEESTAAIAEKLNAVLSDQNKSNMFVTAFFGVLDLLSGDLCYTNAGHNPPLIISDENSFMEIPPAIPIAAFPDTKYSESTIHLSDNTTLLLYTDGVVEAENCNGELYGEERLKMLIDDNYSSSGEIVDKVYSSVVEFSDGVAQSDDITLLCIKYNKHSRIYQKLEDLETLPDFIKSSLQVESCPSDNSEYDELGVSMLTLALEELMVNILEYSTSSKLSLSINNIGEKKFRITLIDSGTAFDPTLSPEVDTSQRPEERKEGGLGLHIAKQVFEKMEYKRIDDLNILYAFIDFSKNPISTII